MGGGREFNRYLVIKMKDVSTCPKCGGENWYLPGDVSVTCFKCSSDYNTPLPTLVASSICIRCQTRNVQDVNHTGEATVKCRSCSATYRVKSYRIKDRTRSVKDPFAYYRATVYRPDGRETALGFPTKTDIELRAGDRITGSFDGEHRLRYLINHSLGTHIDVQKGVESGGCGGLLVMVFLFGLGLVALVRVL